VCFTTPTVPRQFADGISVLLPSELGSSQFCCFGENHMEGSGKSQMNFCRNAALSF
jgi:hypothetical protein